MPHGAILTAKQRKLLIVCAMRTKTVRAVCLKDRLPPLHFIPAWPGKSRPAHACSWPCQIWPCRPYDGGLAGPVVQSRPGWPGQPMQAWLDKLWHAWLDTLRHVWRDISAMIFPACPGTAAARTLRDLSVHELGLVAVLLKPDTTVSCTLFGQQHVKESKGIVLNFIVESKLHQTA